MGRVVNKSFKQVRKSIDNKTLKLLEFISENFKHIDSSNKWSLKQSKIYDRLGTLCHFLLEEIDNLDEIEVPEFEKNKK